MASAEGGKRKSKAGSKAKAGSEKAVKPAASKSKASKLEGLKPTAKAASAAKKDAKPRLGSPTVASPKKGRRVSELQPESLSPDLKTGPEAAPQGGTKVEVGQAQRPPMFPLMEGENIELPRSYGQDRLVTLARDPWWIFAYWELSQQKIQEAIHQFEPGLHLRGVIRVYDITDLEFNGANAHSFKDFEVHFDAESFYLNMPANRRYLAELGFLDPKGKFLALLRSNPVALPREDPSLDLGKDWTDFNEAMWEIFRLSGGLAAPGDPSSDRLSISAELSRRSFFASSYSGRSSGSWGKRQ